MSVYCQQHQDSEPQYQAIKQLSLYWINARLFYDKIQIKQLGRVRNHWAEDHPLSYKAYQQQTIS